MGIKTATTCCVPFFVVLVVIYYFIFLIGRLNDIYGDYKYTYQACGIVLIVASIYLFIGMTIHYRLLAKEQKEQEKMRSQETNGGEAEHKIENELSVLPQNSDDIVKEEESNI